MYVRTHDNDSGYLGRICRFSLYDKFYTAGVAHYPDGRNSRYLGWHVYHHGRWILFMDSLWNHSGPMAARGLQRHLLGDFRIHSDHEAAST
jgi:hypothetical protein